MSANRPSILIPPEWLCQHPELKRRGIILEQTLKPFCVWCTHHLSPPYAVKLIPPESEEAEIYEQLHALDPASPNHTLPCDVIRTDAEQPFLIMPCLEDIMMGPERRNWGLVPLLNFFRQVIEGVEFLHNLNIAHMDMYDGQLIIATARQVAYHSKLEAGKVYIIDFDTSKRFEKGPGRQHAIELPECAYKPPPGITRFDP